MDMLAIVTTPPPPTESLDGPQRRALAVKIRRARRDKGLSQAALAELIGVGESTIGRLERGEGVVRRWQLEALGTQLGVSVEWLLRDEAKAEPHTPEPEQRTRQADDSFTRQYLICPACGQDGLAPNELTPHLMGRHCSKWHTQEEAEAIAPQAVIDPHPWAFVVARYERQLSTAKKASRFRIRGREHWKSLIGIVETSLDRALRTGPEGFFIRNPALDDPYFIREAGMAEQLDWAATISRALELQEELSNGDGDSD